MIGQRDDLIPVREKKGSGQSRGSAIGCLENSANAVSISASVLAFKIMSFTPKACAACCAFFTADRKLGRVGLARKPTDAAAAGTNSRSNSNRFAPSSLFKKLTPVTFPLGWLRLDTKPSSTGLPPLVNTIGIVAVATFPAPTP